MTKISKALLRFMPSAQPGAETWNPQPGERVARVAIRAWGPYRGTPVNIRQTEISKITKAGFVYADQFGEAKFKRGAERYFIAVGSDRHADSHTYLLPLASEDVELLPTRPREGSVFARDVCSIILAMNPRKTNPMYDSAPILAEADEGDDGRYRMRGGLWKRHPDDPEAEFVIFGERAAAGEDEPFVRLGSGDVLLEVFPEFEDAFGLNGASGLGVPGNVEYEATRRLGLTAEQPFSAEMVGKLVRATPQEAELLFMDAMRALQFDDSREPGDTPDLRDAKAVVSAYITEQLPRWEAEARSAIEAHDLVPYSPQEPPSGLPATQEQANG